MCTCLRPPSSLPCVRGLSPLPFAENKRQLKEIEDRILAVLSASTGNILEDESAICVITEAKRLGNEVAAKQRQGEATEAAIDEARTAYAPAGHYLSTLFFCIAGAHERSAVLCAACAVCAAHACLLWHCVQDCVHVCSRMHHNALLPRQTALLLCVSVASTDLVAIDPMYQYSLPWFTKLVLTSLGAAERPDSVATRLDAVKAHFTSSLFRNVCRCGRGARVHGRHCVPRERAACRGERCSMHDARCQEQGWHSPRAAAVLSKVAV